MRYRKSIACFLFALIFIQSSQSFAAFVVGQNVSFPRSNGSRTVGQVASVDGNWITVVWSENGLNLMKRMHERHALLVELPEEDDDHVVPAAAAAAAEEDSEENIPVLDGRTYDAIESIVNEKLGTSPALTSAEDQDVYNEMFMYPMEHAWRDNSPATHIYIWNKQLEIAGQFLDIKQYIYYREYFMLRIKLLSEVQENLAKNQK